MLSFHLKSGNLEAIFNFVFFTIFFSANMFIAVVFLKEKLRADDIFGTSISAVFFCNEALSDF